MAKMKTLKHLRVGELDLDNGGDVARIERNRFADENGETFEALRFCKNRHGRHHRVHLVIKEEAFVELFEDAIKKGVFHEDSIEKLFAFLARQRKTRSGRKRQSRQIPFLDVMGIGADGHLTEGIDEALYGDGQE